MTGDLGWQDEAGFFHFVGRDDDVITSGGYRIGPGSIECILPLTISCCAIRRRGWRAGTRNALEKWCVRLSC